MPPSPRTRFPLVLTLTPRAAAVPATVAPTAVVRRGAIANLRLARCEASAGKLLSSRL